MTFRALLIALALLTCATARAAPTELGDYLLGQTVRCSWPTFDKSGNSATPGTAGTLYVYKDGGTGVVKAVVSDLSGTDTRALGGNAGDEEASFPTTDAFFVAGSDYSIRARGTVVDSQTLNAPICVFSIENRAGTKDRIKARGNLVTGSTAQVIQLGSAAIAASHTWQGLLFCDLATKECAGICDSTDGGGGNDTLNVAGLATLPGATDAYQILWQTIPLSCIPAPPGSGLPLTDNNGGVTMSHAGSSGQTAPAISDNAALSLNQLFNNAGAAFNNQATISALYAAAIAADQHIGTPTNLGSGPTIYANLVDQLGIAHYGQCDGTSTTTVCNNSSLTEIDDYWNNSSSVVIGTMPARCVRDFIQSSHRLVFDALPATAANLYFVLRADPSCRLPSP